MCVKKIKTKEYLFVTPSSSLINQLNSQWDIQLWEY